MGYGASPIFCYIAEFADIGKSITDFRIAEKVMPYHILPTALPVGVSRLVPSFGGISPLTRTILVE